jgi:hypothetical protein
MLRCLGVNSPHVFVSFWCLNVLFAIRFVLAAPAVTSRLLLYRGFPAR